MTRQPVVELYLYSRCSVFSSVLYFNLFFLVFYWFLSSHWSHWDIVPSFTHQGASRYPFHHEKKRTGFKDPPNSIKTATDPHTHNTKDHPQLSRLFFIVLLPFLPLLVATSPAATSPRCAPKQGHRRRDPMDLAVQRVLLPLPPREGRVVGRGDLVVLRLEFPSVS